MSSAMTPVLSTFYGTRSVSTWSPTLQQWQTTITASPRQACTGQ
jgi:hypothetical protein